MADTFEASQTRKLAFLTAGAAGMYCGSCMHDNSLARALIQVKKWDVQLIPTYTPIRTDEQSVTVDQVFFGGINLYLQQKLPLFRYIPQFLDRCLDNPWLIRRLTAKASETSPELLGGLTVSMLKGLHGNQRKEVRRLVHWLKTEVKPDALLLTNILIAGFVPYLKEQLQVPVAVLLQGDDIFLDSLPEKFEQQAVAEIERLGPHVDAFIYHSEFYRQKMNDWFGLDASRSFVTPLTIDTTDFEPGNAGSVDHSSSDSLPSVQHKTMIGYMARIAPEKGLHILVDAFIALRKYQQRENLAPAHLWIAGWLGDHNKQYLATQIQKLDEAGLQADYHFLGTISREDKILMLRKTDIFSVPTTYPEPKGLYVLEALASQTAVVQPEHGAFPEMISQTGGGLLFQPEDSQGLSESLQTLIADPALRQQLATQGQQFVLKHRNQQVMAADTARIFDELWR